MNALPEERLGQLRASKLRALVGARSGDATVRIAAPMGQGAALLFDNGFAAVLDDDAGPRSLGGPLLWAIREQATALLFIVTASEADAGRLARQATWFDLDITVERIDGTTAVPVAPAPWPEPRPVIPVPDDIAALLGGAAVDVVVEGGITRAEVEGLEVARVVESPDGPVLEVGIGKFDREIAAMMHANLAPAETLQRAIDLVRRHRFAAAPIHPLRDLVGERWLRTLLIADPALAGAESLRPLDPTLLPDSLRELQPAAAVGTSADGHTIVAVCAAQVDLDFIAHAADTRASVDPNAELVLCAPARNILGSMKSVAERLVVPARFVELELPY